MFAARSGFSLKNYDRWAKLPWNQLAQMGDSYLKQEDKLDSALLCYTIMSNRYYEEELTKDELYQCTSALNNLGYLYTFRYFDFQKAYNYLEQAKRLSIVSKFDRMLPQIYLNMSALMLNNDGIRNPDKMNQATMSLYSKAFDASIKVKDWKMILNTFNNIANITLGFNQVNTIIPEINKYKTLKIPSKEPMLRFTNLHCIGVEAFLNHDYDKAINAFKEMSKCVNTDETPDRYLLMAYSDLAFTLAHINKIEEAINVTKKAIDIALKNDEKDLIVTFYKDINKYYILVNDKKNADVYYVKYLQQKDSLIYGSKVLNVEQIKFLNDIKEVNDQVKDLSNKKKIQTFVIYSVTIVLILVIIILFVIIRNNRQLKQKNTELYHRNLQMLKDDEERRKLMQKYEEQLTNNENTEPNNAKKYQNSNIDEDTKEELARRILQIMDNTEEICSDAFSLNRLAELTGWKHNYVSQVISEKIQKSFNSMLAEYRIKEACRRMNDTSVYGNYTVEAIAQSVGYKSRSNFASVFKKITGLSPSEYQRLANKQA
jgi:AraC-like DNA-binding protein